MIDSILIFTPHIKNPTQIDVSIVYKLGESFIEEGGLTFSANDIRHITFGCCLHGLEY
jgi:hypothetical protein